MASAILYSMSCWDRHHEEGEENAGWSHQEVQLCHGLCPGVSQRARTQKGFWLNWHLCWTSSPTLCRMPCLPWRAASVTDWFTLTVWGVCRSFLPAAVRLTDRASLHPNTPHVQTPNDIFSCIYISVKCLNIFLYFLSLFFFSFIGIIKPFVFLSSAVFSVQN